MASGLIGNEVPLTGLRVRLPCPPLTGNRKVSGLVFLAGKIPFTILSPCVQRSSFSPYRFERTATTSRR